jgi:hypothetical protein
MILRCGRRFYKVLKLRSKGENSYTFECKDLDTKESREFQFRMNGLWWRERLASKTQAYSTKLVHKKMGSRVHRNPPAPAPYAHNAAHRGFTAPGYVI